MCHELSVERDSEREKVEDNDQHKIQEEVQYNANPKEV